MPFTVAILGRPNVGKSSWFNRLVGSREALVDATPGVSRDWREGQVALDGLHFRVIDTPGLEESAEDPLTSRMSEIAYRAAKQADLCLFLVDARAGTLPEEFHYVARLRRMSCPILLAANKSEGNIDIAAIPGIWRFGLGGALPLSAAHGEGIAALCDAIKEYMEERRAGGIDALEYAEEREREISIAIVGRPNVGKSSLINHLLGEERLLTAPQPGVTRDAIDVALQWRSRDLRIVDTAGMRRPSRIGARLERRAVSDSLRALRRAEIVVLLLDALQGFDRQDARLANRIIEAGRGLVVGINKIDAIEQPKILVEQIGERLDETLPQVTGLFPQGVSAHTGAGVGALMEKVFSMHEVWHARIPTARLNQWLRQVVAAHPLPMHGRSRLRLRYATQVATCPPRFALFCNRPVLPESYRRFLIKEARHAFGLQGVPMRWHVRVGANPYVPSPGRNKPGPLRVSP